MIMRVRICYQILRVRNQIELITGSRDCDCYLVGKGVSFRMRKVLMYKAVENLCTRCGQVRVVSKTWVEKTEAYGRLMVITRSESVCPDGECQAVVAAELAKYRQARENRNAGKKN